MQKFCSNDKILNYLSSGFSKHLFLTFIKNIIFFLFLVVKVLVWCTLRGTFKPIFPLLTRPNFAFVFCHRKTCNLAQHLKTPPNLNCSRNAAPHHQNVLIGFYSATKSVRTDFFNSAGSRRCAVHNFFKNNLNGRKVP